MSARDELLVLVKERSFKEGEFTLASGQKSSFYINLKATTLHPKGATLIGKACVEALKKATIEIDGVGGLTLGADPIATSVSILAFQDGLHWPAFIVRKEPKGHGTNQYIEGTENLKKGANLVVLEDVATTGKSALVAVNRLKDAGYNVSAVLSVVDRDQGAKELFLDQGLKFISILSIEDLKAKKL